MFRRGNLKTVLRRGTGGRVYHAKIGEGSKSILLTTNQLTSFKGPKRGKYGSASLVGGLDREAE